MEGFGIEKMLMLFFIILLLFGSKRIPELASGMGRGIRDFKKALNGVDDEAQQLRTAAAAQAVPAQPAAAAPALAAPAAPALAAETAAAEPKRLS